MVLVLPTMKLQMILTPIFLRVSISFLDDGLGQPEFRDAVDHDAARLVKGLEYGDIVSGSSGIGGGDDTART